MSMIGKTLGTFECTALLGKGGMGEVYKAKDKKLGRDVAIKVLPEEFARDADRVARFQREAKLLASLNHPNIAAIHGLEESDGTHFLVMELVEGITLENYIAGNTGVPAGKKAAETTALPGLLKLALQIAEALEAAHEKGVIHRDLKPANIKVTPDGKVKVLDFGLAKAYAGEGEDMNLSNSPTLSNAATQQGVILGTAAYMSPEQARGKAVDRKADVWAFGCVLFEMLTGRAAFSGRDVTDILAAVIRAEPEWKDLPANLHWRLREVLERCLEKEAKDRYSGINDARVDIQKVLADPAGVFVQPGTTTRSRARFPEMVPWIAGILMVASVVAFAVWKLRTPGPGQLIRFEHYLPENQQFLIFNQSPALAISPDGKKIVYSTPEGLYVRKVDELTAQVVTGSESTSMEPAISPDSKWICYLSAKDRQLKKIAISGGSPAVICDVKGRLQGLSWCQDGTIVYGEQGSGIMRVSDKGGTPEPIAKAESGDHLLLPQILPDGKSLLYTAIPSSGERKIMVKSLQSGESKELLAGIWASYLPTGHIVFRSANTNTLSAVPFDSDRMETTDDPVPIVEGVRQYAVSDNGTLVYIPGSITETKNTLVWVDKDGMEEPLSAPPDDYRYIDISPDGTQIALTISSGNNEDLHIWDIARKNMMKLTFDEADDGFPLWAPDSKRIVFASTRGGKSGIYIRNANGTGEVELISDQRGWPLSWSADGKFILFIGDNSIGMLSMEGDKAAEFLLKEKHADTVPRLSPDGKWLAYMSNEEGQYEVYVRPFPDVNGGKWKVSNNLGLMEQWSQDGRRLYYWTTNALMVVEVETEPTFKPGTPAVYLKRTPISSFSMGSSGISWDIHPDGRFLMLKLATEPGSESTVGDSSKIHIVLNWFEELKERVPAD